MSEPKQLSEKELDAVRAWCRGPGTEQFQPGEVIAMLLDHIDWQREEDDFSYTLNGRLAKILNDTANVLKGPPDELALHSTHDLAAVSARMMGDARRWQFLRDWSNNKERMRLLLQTSTTEGIDVVMDGLIAREQHPAEGQRHE